MTLGRGRERERALRTIGIIDYIPHVKGLADCLVIPPKPTPLNAAISPTWIPLCTELSTDSFQKNSSCCRPLTQHSQITITTRERGWLNGRAPDSWLKGRGFESLQEQRENFILRGQLSVLFDSYFGIRSTPVLLQLQVKDPGHSTKSAEGRLHLNTHAPYVCGYALSDMVHGCMVYTERAETAAVSCGTSHAGAFSTPLRWLLKNAL